MRMMWLGFVFLVAVSLFVAAILLVDNFSFLGSGETLTAYFHGSVNRLRKGDDVLVEGIPYGKVTTVKLLPEGILVACGMDGPVALYGDPDQESGYKIQVESFSILGGNQISIRRGNPAGGAPRMQEGMKNVYVGKLRLGPLDQLGELVSDNQDSLKDATANLRDALHEAKEVLEKVNRGEGTIGKLVNDESLYKNLDETMGKVNRGEGTVGKLINDDTLYRDLTDITGQIRSGPGLVHRLLYDDQLSNDLGETAKNLREMTTDLRDVIHNVKEGKGTIGKLFKDMEQEGKEDLYDSAQRAIDGMDKTLGRAARATVWLGAGSISFDESEASTARLFIRYEPDDSKYFNFGVAFLNFSEGGETVVFERQVEDQKDQTFIKPELSIAYRIPWFWEKRLTFELGLIEGLPGGALKYQDDDWGFVKYPVEFTLEARDSYNDLQHDDIDENVNGPMVRAYLKTPLFPQGEGWFGDFLHHFKVFAGASRIGDDPEFMVGVTFEYVEEDIRTLIGLLSAS